MRGAHNVTSVRSTKQAAAAAAGAYIIGIEQCQYLGKQTKEMCFNKTDHRTKNRIYIDTPMSIHHHSLSCTRNIIIKQNKAKQNIKYQTNKQ